MRAKLLCRKNSLSLPAEQEARSSVSQGRLEGPDRNFRCCSKSDEQVRGRAGARVYKWGRREVGELEGPYFLSPSRNGQGLSRGGAGRPDFLMPSICSAHLPRAKLLSGVQNLKTRQALPDGQRFRVRIIT